MKTMSPSSTSLGVLFCLFFRITPCYGFVLPVNSFTSTQPSHLGMVSAQRSFSSTNSGSGDRGKGPNHFSDVNRRLKRTNNQQKNTNDNKSKQNVDNEITRQQWKHAEDVENQLIVSLEIMRKDLENLKRKKTKTGEENRHLQLPTAREANRALATFGDSGHFLRSLSMFVKMRKISSLAKILKESYSDAYYWYLVPSPTLVTYSTLMSRAILKAGKPQIALRIWNLMTMQDNFFNNNKSEIKRQTLLDSKSVDVIIPDIKAVNILINAYAKLADIESVKDLVPQILYGNGTKFDSVPPLLKPNLVTYNSILDACQKSSDLDYAMVIKKLIDDYEHEEPNRASSRYYGTRNKRRRRRTGGDARTYTTLISTVARGPSKISGKSDPTLAFSLFNEMVSRGIRPNGMTYCALIDVCHRCNRSDLALKALRLMLRQKSKQQEQQQSTRYQGKQEDLSLLPNEVGAWTAAINACGKAGRTKTAKRLFYAMSTNFGVTPNTITCSCLTDCLLKAGKTIEALDILRYMKKENIKPSVSMYTSLMTHASALVQIENELSLQKNKAHYAKEKESSKREGGDHSSDEELDTDDDITLPTTIDIRVDKNRDDEHAAMDVSNADGARAIEVYTELMKTLLSTLEQRERNVQNMKQQVQQQTTESASNEGLLKVFLVFQEMRSAGANPDITCFNVLLRACAKAGDYIRAQDVLDMIIADKNLTPGDMSFRWVIRAAGKGRRCDIAESIWKYSLLQYNGLDSASNNSRKSIPEVGENNSDQERQSSNEMRHSTKSTARPSQSPASRKDIQKPSIETFAALLSAYLTHASSLRSAINRKEAKTLYEKVVTLYAQILDDKKPNDSESKSSASTENNSNSAAAARNLHISSCIDVEQVHGSQRVMLLFLRAVVALERLYESETRIASYNGQQTQQQNENMITKQQQERARAKKKVSMLRNLGKSISNLPCLKEEELSTNLRSRSSLNALHLARTW